MNLNDKVEKIMTSGLTAINENTPVSNLKDLIDRRRIHHILVENEVGELLGIISTIDIIRRPFFPVRKEHLLAKHIMTINPVTVTNDTPIKKIINHFLDNRFRAIPIVDDKDILVGIVTPYDIMSALLDQFEEEEEVG